MFRMLVLISLGMLEVNILSNADYNVFALVLGRQLVRRPAVVLHPELVDNVRG